MQSKVMSDYRAALIYNILVPSDITKITTSLDKYLAAVQGQNTSIRDAMSKEGNILDRIA
jgi:hypothetical protein